MGISCRMFLLDQDDGLYRLSSAKFNQILRDPTSCRLTRFAGARVRMTNVAVELLDRQWSITRRRRFGSGISGRVVKRYLGEMDSFSKSSKPFGTSPRFSIRLNTS